MFFGQAGTLQAPATLGSLFTMVLALKECMRPYLACYMGSGFKLGFSWLCYNRESSESSLQHIIVSEKHIVLGCVSRNIGLSFSHKL